MRPASALIISAVALSYGALSFAQELPPPPPPPPDYAPAPSASGVQPQPPPLPTVQPDGTQLLPPPPPPPPGVAPAVSARAADPATVPYNPAPPRAARRPVEPQRGPVEPDKDQVFAQSSPQAEIPWDGNPVPPGFHLEKRPRWGMIVPGSLMLIAGAALCITYLSHSEEQRGYSENSLRTETGLVGLGLFGGGAALLGLGAVRGYPYVVAGPEPPPPVAPATQRPRRERHGDISWTLSPVLSGTRAGLHAGFAF